MKDKPTYNTISGRWQKYQGAVLWQALPYDPQTPSYAEAVKAVKENRAIFARWTSDFDLGTKSEWWYCVCDRFTKIEDLTSKQRYRVKRGLANCQIDIYNHLSENQIEDICQLFVESFADYPDAYRPKIDGEETKRWLHQLMSDSSIDVWLCYKDAQLIGFCYCQLEKDVVWLKQVKVPTKHLGTDVNAALGYKICEYYLEQKSYRFICDGERNIKHQTNYQDFLIRVLNFRYAYCKLNIVYAWWMRIVIAIIFPFRKIIGILGIKSPQLYNVYCVLKQEEIRKSFI